VDPNRKNAIQIETRCSALAERHCSCVAREDWTGRSLPLPTRSRPRGIGIFPECIARGDGAWIAGGDWLVKSHSDEDLSRRADARENPGWSARNLVMKVM
jgi:hypothetical protein